MVTIGYAVLAIAIGLIFFLNSYVTLLPGVIIIWGEIVVGLLANRVAYRLTRRAVALKGLAIEQNSIMRGMLASGNFRLIWAVYSVMVILGAALTWMSFRIGAVQVPELILLPAFTVPLIVDAMNDLYWIRRFDKESPMSPLSP